MKLSEIKGEKAIEAFANLLEPVGEILADKEFTEGLRTDKSKIELAQVVMKSHAKAIIKILAILDDKDPENYEINLAMLPVKLAELMNDKGLLDLFTGQSQAG